MRKPINLNEWPRKEHFAFFRQFDEPFFGVCVDIECETAYKKCKENSYSFFVFYLHKALKAANRIESFRYRIAEDAVYLYDQVNASPTINRPDGTFGFGYMDYQQDFHRFHDEAKKVIDEVQHSQGLTPSVAGDNVIHFSALPWVDFTSMSHARNFSFKDSCPKISFGKMTGKGNKKVMPVSVHVHHGLMDGYHVSQFIDEFQQLMKLDNCV